MAGLGNQLPFNNDEKNYVLAELIKSASPPYGILLEICNRLNVQPRFEDIPLPPGRTANACRSAFEEMRRGPMYSPVSQGGSVLTPTPLSAPVPSLKRPMMMDLPSSTSSYSTGRTILPKTTTYAYPTSMSEPPQKRKRGRPTKAEQQARAEQIGESSSMAAARLQTPLSASMPPSPSVDTRPAAMILPPVSRMPISAIVSTPAAAPKSASHSSSSSGKRRRRRRSEEQSTQEGSAGSNRYGSPYPRIVEETPARATIRRRDEPIHSSVARLGVSEPEQSPGAQATISPRPPYGGST